MKVESDNYLLKVRNIQCDVLVKLSGKEAFMFIGTDKK